MLFSMNKMHNIFFYMLLSQINGFIWRAMLKVNDGLWGLLYKKYWRSQKAKKN